MCSSDLSGLVNVDFADIQSVMSEAGMAVIGVGSASGNDRAVKAVSQAINSPLLDISIDGARSVLFGIAGRSDLKMSEINDAAKIISDSVDPSAKIIFGAYNDRKLRVGQLKIILIAAGFSGMSFRREPDSLKLFSPDTGNGDAVDDGEKLKHNTNEPTTETEKSAEQTPKKQRQEEDIWDIPTFLRKKGKKR